MLFGISAAMYAIGAFMLFSIGAYGEEDVKPSPIWAWLLMAALWPLVMAVCLVLAGCMRIFGWKRTEKK